MQRFLARDKLDWPREISTALDALESQLDALRARLGERDAQLAAVIAALERRERKSTSLGDVRQSQAWPATHTAGRCHSTFALLQPQPRPTRKLSGRTHHAGLASPAARRRKLALLHRHITEELAAHAPPEEPAGAFDAAPQPKTRLFWGSRPALAAGATCCVVALLLARRILRTSFE